jgi:hypothetical protein
VKTLPLESGIHAGDLPSLSRLLKQWQSIVQKTTKEWLTDDQAPWWYNERASLGLLAGAIWQRDGFVFEEYSTYRKIDTKRGATWKHGRCDMDFRLGNKDFVAEAKQCWPTLGMHKENAIPVIKSSLQKAKDQVAQVKARNYHPLAIAFVVPKIPVNYESEMNDNLSELIQNVSALRKTATAWVFPKRARRLRTSRDNSYYNYFFPGIILVVMSCKA